MIILGGCAAFVVAVLFAVSAVPAAVYAAGSRPVLAAALVAEIETRQDEADLATLGAAAGRAWRSLKSMAGSIEEPPAAPEKWLAVLVTWRLGPALVELQRDHLRKSAQERLDVECRRLMSRSSGQPTVEVMARGQNWVHWSVVRLAAYGLARHGVHALRFALERTSVTVTSVTVLGLLVSLLAAVANGVATVSNPSLLTSLSYGATFGASLGLLIGCTDCIRSVVTQLAGAGRTAASQVVWVFLATFGFVCLVVLAGYQRGPMAAAVAGWLEYPLDPAPTNPPVGAASITGLDVVMFVAFLVFMLAILWMAYRELRKIEHKLGWGFPARLSARVVLWWMMLVVSVVGLLMLADTLRGSPLVEQGSVLSWALLVVLGWPAPVLTTSVVAAFVPALGDRLRRRAEPRPLSGFAVLVVYGLICVLVTPLASVVAVLVVGWIFNTDMPPGAPTVPMIFLTAVVVWRGWKRHRRNQRRRAELQVAKVVAGLR